MTAHVRVCIQPRLPAEISHALLQAGSAETRCNRRQHIFSYVRPPTQTQQSGLYSHRAHFKIAHAEQCVRFLSVLYLTTWLKVAIMTIYKIYAAHGVTWYGTKRVYIGSTRSLKVRSHFHRLRSTQPAWMRCWTDEDPSYVILKSSLYPKDQALLYEALLAAKAIKADPQQARGGPWSTVHLSQFAFAQISEVARLNNVSELFAYAQKDKRSALWQHLRDVAFDTNLNSESGRAGAYSKSGRSGTAGNKWLKKALKSGRIVRGTPEHRQCKRGGISRTEEYRRRNARDKALRMQ